MVQYRVVRSPRNLLSKSDFQFGARPPAQSQTFCLKADHFSAPHSYRARPMFKAKSCKGKLMLRVRPVFRVRPSSKTRKVQNSNLSRNRPAFRARPSPKFTPSFKARPNTLQVLRTAIHCSRPSEHTSSHTKTFHNIKVFVQSPAFIQSRLSNQS